jgi:FkbM family methyltransferase
MIRSLVKRILASRRFNALCRWWRVREIYFLVSPSFTPFVVAEAGDLRYAVRTRDLSVSRELFVRRGFDDEVMPRVLALLDHYGYQSARSKTFVDIGANIGTSVIPAVHTHGFARGIAFEPEPVNHQLIQVNALLNGVADRIVAHKFALSDRPGELVFEIAPENSGDNRVRTTHDAPASTTTRELHNESRRPTITVEATTFDILLDRRTLNLEDIGLIWMDTQGHEGHVLAGATRLLASDVPILMEYWPYALGRSGGQERLELLIREHYTHFIDVRDCPNSGVPVATPVDRLRQLRDKYQGVNLTDLLLVKAAAGSGKP